MTEGYLNARVTIVIRDDHEIFKHRHAHSDRMRHSVKLSKSYFLQSSFITKISH